MPVKSYVTRDPSGNPWPPVHEHEATAVIGLIQFGVGERKLGRRAESVATVPASA